MAPKLNSLIDNIMQHVPADKRAEVQSAYSQAQDAASRVETVAQQQAAWWETNKDVATRASADGPEQVLRADGALRPDLPANRWNRELRTHFGWQPGRTPQPAPGPAICVRSTKPQRDASHFAGSTRVCACSRVTTIGSPDWRWPPVRVTRRRWSNSSARPVTMCGG